MALVIDEPYRRFQVRRLPSVHGSLGGCVFGHLAAEQRSSGTPASVPALGGFSPVPYATCDAPGCLSTQATGSLIVGPQHSATSEALPGPAGAMQVQHERVAPLLHAGRDFVDPGSGGAWCLQKRRFEPTAHHGLSLPPLYLTWPVARRHQPTAPGRPRCPTQIGLSSRSPWTAWNLLLRPLAVSCARFPRGSPSLPC